MPSRMFNRGMFEIINQTTNWVTADIEVLLVDNTYVFNPDSNFVADVSADEIATTNYTRRDLQNATITEDDVNDRVVLDADDETWPALGPPSGGPVVQGIISFRNTGNDATSPVIVYNEFTAATQVNGGDFTVEWEPAASTYPAIVRESKLRGR